VFASAAARRLGARGDNVAAMPFTVRPVGTGSGHLAEGEAMKGELWLPVWDEPVTYPELKRFVGEGRLRWRGGHAGNAVDAARAITTLGTDRGVAAFTRYSIAERMGQSPLAVPAGRVATGYRSGVALSGQLDPWIARVRRQKNLPSSAARALRHIDASLVALAGGHRHGEAKGLLDVLHAIAALDRIVGVSRAISAAGPLPWLDPNDWLAELDDGSLEFELAAGWASLHTTTGKRINDDWDTSTARPSVAQYLRPVGPKSMAWTKRGSVVGSIESLGPRRVVHEVLAVHSRFAAPFPASTSIAPDRSEAPRFDAWNRGVDPGFENGRTVRPLTVQTFVDGHLDQMRIGRILQALTLLDPRKKWPSDAREHQGVLDPVLTLLAPFLHGRPVTVRWGADATRHTVRLAARSTWIRQLLRGPDGVRAVWTEARTMLRVAGLRPAVAESPPRADGPCDGARHERLVAALALRLDDTTTSSLIKRIADPTPQLLLNREDR